MAAAQAGLVPGAMRPRGVWLVGATITKLPSEMSNQDFQEVNQ